jgi:hypothetical protein
MSTFQLPPFGELNPQNLEEFYDAEIEYAGRTIETDLNFEDSTIDLTSLEKVKEWIFDPQRLDTMGRDAIAKDVASGDTVKEYIEHHRDELDAEDVEELIKGGDQDLSREERLAKALHLVRIGFYPHDRDNFIILDYSLGRELTQYLVVVNLTADGEVDYLTMES